MRPPSRLHALRVLLVRLAVPVADPRRRAIVDYAAKLTWDPAAIGPDDALWSDLTQAHHICESPVTSNYG